MSDTQSLAVTVAGYHTPEPVKAYDVWVVWCPELGKVARAPWQEGHMYPAKWAQDRPVDPRTTYDQASATATLPVDTLASQYPFPDDKQPSKVLPTILIPPASADNDLLFVDFDDVVVDGRITAEAWRIIQRLGGYSEVSRSFMDATTDTAGVHTWVRGELPDGYGKVIANLDDRGQIEMYDHSRMTGCTWRHIEGTPRNAIPEVQDTIDGLVDTYADDPPAPATGEQTRDATANDTGVNDGFRTRENPYYTLNITDIADTGAFAQYRTDERNPAHDRWQGPHPGHDATSPGKADVDSSNFSVDPTGGCWHCFAHNSGGGGLSLIGVLDDQISVDCRHAQRVYRDRRTLLKTCLVARDDYAPELRDETPPYQALVAVANLAELHMSDPDEKILGETTHAVAERIYDELTAGEVPTA